MPIGDHLGGFIRPGFNPLLAPGAPTIGTASSGGSLNISIAFTAPSDVGGGAITSYEAVATERTTFVVTVVDSGSGNKFVIDGVSQDTLTLQEGATYTFDQSAGTNSTHPLRLSTTSDGTHGGGSEYTTGVTTNGTPGSAGAYTRIVVASGAPTLYYYCSSHSGMGGTVNTTTGATSFTATGTSSPITVTGLIEGQSYTTTVTAINAYGPSGISGTSNSVQAEDVAGELWTWGYNAEGQLGQGNGTVQSSPVQIGALSTWLQLTAGYQFQILHKTDGTLWGVGINDVGQLGVNTGTAAYSSLIQVGTLTDWTTEIGAGRSHFSAIKTDGTLWAWGSGSNGRLGLGNTTNYSSPKQVGALTTWSKLSCGDNFTAAIKTDGTLWTWGYGGRGQLGQGSITSYSSPVQIGALTTWSKVGCGHEFLAAIKTDGTMWAVGYNTDGALGQGNTTSYSSPVQVGALTTWSKIAGGNKGMAVLKTDGTLWTVGYGENGELGNSGSVSASSLVQVGALTTWADVSRGTQSVYGRTTGKTLYAWGRNSQGRLGLGNTTYYSSPKQIGALSTWKVSVRDIGSSINGAAIKS